MIIPVPYSVKSFFLASSIQNHKLRVVGIPLDENCTGTVIPSPIMGLCCRESGKPCVNAPFLPAEPHSYGGTFDTHI